MSSAPALNTDHDRKRVDYDEQHAIGQHRCGRRRHRCGRRRHRRGRDHHGGLSNLEFEIAGLVAAGRSNRQIATELYLSERTVESHISHVFSKLEVGSRVDVAIWYASRSAAQGRAAP